MYKVIVKEIIYDENSSCEYGFNTLASASEFLLDNYYEWIDNIDNDNDADDMPSLEIFHEENLITKVNSRVPLIYVGHEDQSDYYLRVYLSQI
jgi:hypothetical protein